jgi:hypothetical protein
MILFQSAIEGRAKYHGTMSSLIAVSTMLEKFTPDTQEKCILPELLNEKQHPQKGED